MKIWLITYFISEDIFFLIFGSFWSSFSRFFLIFFQIWVLKWFVWWLLSIIFFFLIFRPLGPTSTSVTLLHLTLILWQLRIIRLRFFLLLIQFLKLQNNFTNLILRNSYLVSSRHTIERETNQDINFFNREFFLQSKRWLIMPGFCFLLLN